MVVSTFNFFNEIDLLRLRLEYLSPVVDRFVLVESSVTHGGWAKPFYFDEVSSEFKDYPITHVKIEDAPFGPDPWAREHHQHQRNLAAVAELNPEIVLFTDADEIPHRNVVERFRSLNTNVANLGMDFLLYYADRIDPQGWPYPKICKFAGVEPVRRHFAIYPCLPDAGWHFEYVGGTSYLLDKINATAHCADQGSRVMWQSVYKGQKPGLERTVPYARERLPQLVQDIPSRYGLCFSPA